MRHTKMLLGIGFFLLGLPATAWPYENQLLADKLKLTAAQQPIFGSWDATYVGDPKRLASLSSAELSAKDGLELAANWIAWAEYRMEWTRREATALQSLYAALTPVQQKVFNDNLLPKSEKDAPPVAPVPDDQLPTSAGPAKPGMTTADWARQPTSEEFSAFYPLMALRQKKTGTVTIACDVTTLGVAVDCVVEGEEPHGYGFGNATIEIASAFRFHPAKFYGVPVEGQVKIPLKWQLEVGAPPAPEAPKANGRN